MKYTTKAAEKSTVKITMEFDGTEWKDALNKAYLKTKGRFAVNGFRKGKAPRNVIEHAYGKGVFFEDALNVLFSENYGKVLEEKEKEFTAVGDPELAVDDLSDEKVVLVATTPVKPEVKIGSYKGMKIKEFAYTVKDADVDKEMERLLDRNSRKVPVTDRPAQNGDVVNIDFVGTVDGVKFDGGEAEKFDLTLGSGQFIPGFEEQVVGMSAGEEKDIDVTFPEEYHAKELAGKPVVFHVKVNSITVEHIPAKDDEFAKDVSEFDTLDELRADIRTKELEERTKAVERTFETAAVEKAAENATMEMPESLVEEELDRQMNNFAYQLQRSGMSMEQYAKMMGGDMGTMRKAFRPAAEKQAKVDVTLQAIIKAEGLEVSDEEVEAEYQSLADTYQMELEKVKALAGADSLRQDLLVRKAAKLVAEAAVPVAPKAEEEPKTEE